MALTNKEIKARWKNRKEAEKAGVKFVKCRICRKLTPEQDLWQTSSYCLNCSEDIINNKQKAAAIWEAHAIDVSDPRTFRTVRTAQEDGRLHPDLADLLGVETGEHACRICGMTHWEPEDAGECCAPAIDRFWTERCAEFYISRRGMGGTIAYACIVDHTKLILALARACSTTEAGDAQPSGPGRPDSGINYRAMERLTGAEHETCKRWLWRESVWISRLTYDRLVERFGEAPGCVPWPEGTPKPAEVAEAERGPQVRAMMEEMARGMSTAALNVWAKKGAR